MIPIILSEINDKNNTLNDSLITLSFECELFFTFRANCEIKYLLEVISIFLITSSAEWFIQSSKFMRICFTLVGFLQRGINFTLLLTYFYVNKTLLRVESSENNRPMALVESTKIWRENVSTWKEVAGLLVTATTDKQYERINELYRRINIQFFCNWVLTIRKNWN